MYNGGKRQWVFIFCFVNRRAFILYNGIIKKIKEIQKYIHDLYHRNNAAVLYEHSSNTAETATHQGLVAKCDEAWVLVEAS